METVLICQDGRTDIGTRSTYYSSLIQFLTPLLSFICTLCSSKVKEGLKQKLPPYSHLRKEKKNPTIPCHATPMRRIVCLKLLFLFLISYQLRNGPYSGLEIHWFPGGPNTGNGCSDNAGRRRRRTKNTNTTRSNHITLDANCE